MSTQPIYKAVIQPEYALSEAVPDVAAGPSLEAFCAAIGQEAGRRRWHILSPVTLVEALANEFRRAFHVGVPAAPHVLALPSKLDIALVRRESGEQGSSTFDCALPDGPWQAVLPEEAGLRESLHLLRSLFSILFWRLERRVAWWAEWRASHNVEGPGRLADVFAYAVLMPPEPLRERAHALRLNVWRIADAFLISPGAAFYGLRRHVRLDFPYFLARLNFHVDMDQQQFFFSERSVRAKVWTKFLAGAGGQEGDGELTSLRGFPRQDTVVEVTGFLKQSILERRPMIAQTDRLLGVRLSCPVAIACRPNAGGTQLLVQCVPFRHYSFLMDEELHLQQTELRERKAA